VGTEFWTAFGSNVSPGTNYIYLSGNTATSATVSVPGISFTQDVSITPGTVASVAVPGSTLGTVDSPQDLGIHITAGAPVSVYGLEDVVFSSDGFTALPVSAIGTDYYALGYDTGGLSSDFQVVGTTAGTTVTITPTSTAGGHTGGVPYTVQLNAGQVYQLTGAPLTGTHISSTSPVSVLSGNQCVDIPVGYAYCNYIAEQLPPTSEWGTDFVTEPLATRTKGDTFRVMADTNGTTVTINGANVATLDAGKYYETQLTTASVVHSSAPVLVAQFSDSTTYDGAGNADPSEMLVPPDQQFLNSYTVSTAPDSRFTNYLNVVAPTVEVGSVMLNGTAIPASSFSAISGSNFSGAQLPVATGTYTVTGPQAFGLFSYGFGITDAYSEPGGYGAGQVANASSLTLSPMSQFRGIGQQACVTATVEDQGHNPLAGIGVSFAVTGANPNNGFASTQSNGKAVYCYTGSAKGLDTIKATAAGLSAGAVVDYGGAFNSNGPGYRLGAADGGVFAFGTSQFYGNMVGNKLNGPEVAMAATPDNLGYWLVASDGGVFAYGDAGFYGSLGNLTHLNAPIVGMAATPTGNGYWLVAADGGVFAFGDAAYLGAVPRPFNASIVGIAATPSGNGYWLAGADGGVFAFGDAGYVGSQVGKPLAAPVVGIARSVDGGGYWLIGSDGGVFAFGDAPFAGSMAGYTLDGPEVAVVPTADGQGYWLDAKDGGVFAFGDAPFLGSLPSIGLTPFLPVGGITS
jgi:hypothetical protein